MMNMTQSKLSLKVKPPAFVPAAFAVVIFLLSLLGQARPARAVHEEWNRGWRSAQGQDDGAGQIAVDKSGNIYVAGYSGGVSNQNADYRLIKYRPDGSEVWTRGYDGPAHGDDRVTGLALDKDGNAYITGSSQGDSVSYAGFDYATIKYDPDGRRLWVKRYDAGHNTDAAAGLALDAAGDVYVTGTSYAAIPGGFADYATLKYSPTGHLFWVRRYESSNQSNEFATAIAVDAAGNAYVTGEGTLGSDTGADIATVKYSSSGDQLWVSFYAQDSVDIGYAVAVDAAGSVYVTGQTYVGPYTEDGSLYVTIKYDSEGHEIWTELFGQEEIYSYPTALALDPSGGVVVTGNSGTIKLDANGQIQWLGDNLGGYGAALAVDTAGCVYVAGEAFGSAGSRSMSLIKYGGDGRLHWARFYDKQTAFAGAGSVALDSVGNVYVTGATSGFNFSDTLLDIRTLKYSQPILAGPYQPIPGLP